MDGSPSRIHSIATRQTKFSNAIPLQGDWLSGVEERFQDLNQTETASGIVNKFAGIGIGSSDNLIELIWRKNLT